MVDLARGAVEVLGSMVFKYIDKHLTPSARYLLIGLFLVEIALVAINLIHYALGFPIDLVHMWFYLDHEHNFASWFSSSQLLLIATCFLALGALANPKLRLNWFFYLVSAGFAFLSMDEGIAFHELTWGLIKRHFMDWQAGDNSIIGGAVFAYPTLGIILVALNWRSIWTSWQHFRVQSIVLATGVGIYVFGAAGVEAVSFEFETRDPKNIWYLLQVSIEEFLEMVGCTVILCGSMILLFTVPLREVRAELPQLKADIEQAHQPLPGNQQDIKSGQPEKA